MAILSAADTATLCNMITNGEDWLVDRVLYYARRQGYTRYSSTLRDDWRQSIHGLSASVLLALDGEAGHVELSPEEDLSTNSLARFGITEAICHKRRGISLTMFMGLLKYYRQGYIDLIDQQPLDQDCNRRFSLVLTRIFDRIEIGLCTAWHSPPMDDQLTDLQQANRAITNEKNKYLTIFESLYSPAAVLNLENQIVANNQAWSTLFGNLAAPAADSHSESLRPPAPWLAKEIQRFNHSQANKKVLEKMVSTNHGERCFFIRIQRMQDVSLKFSGCVIILDDVTLQKQAEAATRSNERLHGVLELAGAVCHDMNQPLMVLSGYAELLLMDCPGDAPLFPKLEKIVEQVKKLSKITKKLMHVTRYETKPYLDRQIIDIEKSSDVE